jgi:Lrp/AsnC family transcriptional regulator, leucine-responsive regulatory protein
MAYPRNPQAGARLSFVELGRRVGLSTPTTTERVRKLEDTGVITGYHALVDPFKLGISMQVIVRIAVNGHGPQSILVIRTAQDAWKKRRPHFSKEAAIH